MCGLSPWGPCAASKHYQAIFDRSDLLLVGEFAGGFGVGYGIVEDLYLGVTGYWVGLACGLTCAAVVLVTRFNRVSKHYVRTARDEQQRVS